MSYEIDPSTHPAFAGLGAVSVALTRAPQRVVELDRRPAPPARPAPPVRRPAALPSTRVASAPQRPQNQRQLLLPPPGGPAAPPTRPFPVAPNLRGPDRRRRRRVAPGAGRLPWADDRGSRERGRGRHRGRGGGQGGGGGGDGGGQGGGGGVSDPLFDDVPTDTELPEELPEEPTNELVPGVPGPKKPGVSKALLGAGVAAAVAAFFLLE